MYKAPAEGLRVTVSSSMKEQLTNLITELKVQLEDYQEAAQEMLDNADINNELQDAEDYGVFVGKAEILEDIIEKLEKL